MPAATELTEAQYQTLKTDITVTNSAEFVADVQANRHQAIADKYNLAATPTFQVYKIAVTKNAILFERSPQGTVFVATTTGWLTITAQAVELFKLCFDDNHIMDPSQFNMNAILTTIFAGTGDAQLNRVHIGNQSREVSTRAERLYITSGAGTNGDPGIRAWKGMLNNRDIAHALDPTVPLT
jgi:hypothetical protein